jgi:tripartite ATP-independent transporter DctP family solute receptor
LTAVVLALTLACGGGGADGGPKKVTLSLPHVLPPEHPVSIALERFAAEVGERSGGQMIVKVQGGGTLGSEQELCDNVSSDADAFTKISSTILETKTELANIYSLPYLFRDEDHMWKVFNGEVGRELLDMAIDQNLKGICYFDAGARSFYTKNPVNSAPDLRGVKIRVQKSVMMEKLVATLGASPQQIAYSELYTALDTGVVDGAENNIPSYFTSRHYKVAPNYIFNEHARIPDILLMSARRWNSLTADQQRIIMDAAKSASEFQRELWAEKNINYVEQMEGEGVTFIRPTADAQEQFRDITRSVYDLFQGTKVMEYVDRIRAVE